MYRQIITPDKKNHIIELPEKFFGKKVEVIAFEVEETESISIKKQPSQNNFLKDIDFIPDFPSVKEIRSDAWPEKI